MCILLQRESETHFKQIDTLESSYFQKDSLPLGDLQFRYRILYVDGKIREPSFINRMLRRHLKNKMIVKKNNYFNFFLIICVNTYSKYVFILEM